MGRTARVLRDLRRSGPRPPRYGPAARPRSRVARPPPAWPLGPNGQARTLPAGELALRLLPVAQQGLEAAGVASEEAGRLLAVVEARAASGQTGAAWQRRALDALGSRHDREAALAAMLERHLDLQRTGEPVHSWPLPAA